MKHTLENSVAFSTKAEPVHSLGPGNSTSSRNAFGGICTVGHTLMFTAVLPRRAQIGNDPDFNSRMSNTMKYYTAV